jgi:hypothetical protein
MCPNREAYQPVSYFSKLALLKNCPNGETHQPVSYFSKLALLKMCPNGEAYQPVSYFSKLAVLKNCPNGEAYQPVSYFSKLALLKIPQRVLVIISSKGHLFSSLYSWQIAHVALNNNQSLWLYRELSYVLFTHNSGLKIRIIAVGISDLA